MSTPIDNIASRDGTPGRTVVQDFYQTEDVEPSLSDQWEPIEEDMLDELGVPGHPDIIPHRAWRVVTGSGVWMVYMWYESTGRDSDVYLYERKGIDNGRTYGI
jgi:hypothetical protein